MLFLRRALTKLFCLKRMEKDYSLTTVELLQQDFVLDKRDMFGNETEWEDTAKKDGFKGFIRLGDSLDI